MSIKNIIQQENDLQEMSQRSLANYLNNPTGQYNPYLVAGELQRKEQFAQRQMIEAPQETVVDELVQKTMPMGGMPMPRPQEAMVSDTITETGIANLPAPNIGQNYAEGGIIGYEDGGEVDYKGLGEDLVVEAGLMSIFGLPGMFMAPNELGDATLYDDEDFAEALANQDSDMTGAAAVGAGVVANEARKKAIKKKAAKTKIKPIKPTKAGLVKAGGVAALEAGKKILNKLKPTPKKKLTKKEQDAFLNKQKTPPQTALEKANQFKKPSTKGPVTQGIIDAAKFVGPKIGPGIRATGRGIKNYAGELGLAGGVGLGIDALLNEGVLYGETPEEKALREAQERYDSPAEVKKRADIARDIANKAKEQERADALQAQRDAAAKRRAYLALALGGAKTMAGESPYALTNIGAGLGTGVASLVELDEAAAARQSAELLADAKLRNDLYKESRNQMDTFNELKKDLRGGTDQTFTQIFLGRLDDKGIDPADVTNPDYIKIENQTILDLYPGAAPAGSTVIDGQPFIGV